MKTKAFVIAMFLATTTAINLKMTDEEDDMGLAELEEQDTNEALVDDEALEDDELDADEDEERRKGRRRRRCRCRIRRMRRIARRRQRELAAKIAADAMAAKNAADAIAAKNAADAMAAKNAADAMAAKTRADALAAKYHADAMAAKTAADAAHAKAMTDAAAIRAHQDALDAKAAADAAALKTAMDAKRAADDLAAKTAADATAAAALHAAKTAADAKKLRRIKWQADHDAATVACNARNAARAVFDVKNVMLADATAKGDKILIIKAQQDALDAKTMFVAADAVCQDKTNIDKMNQVIAAKIAEDEAKRHHDRDAEKIARANEVAARAAAAKTAHDATMAAQAQAKEAKAACDAAHTAKDALAIAVKKLAIETSTGEKDRIDAAMVMKHHAEIVYMTKMDACNTHQMAAKTAAETMARKAEHDAKMAHNNDAAEIAHKKRMMAAKDAASAACAAAEIAKLHVKAAEVDFKDQKQHSKDAVEVFAAETRLAEAQTSYAIAKTVCYDKMEQVKRK